MLVGFSMKVCVLVAQSCPTLRPHGLQPTRFLCPWDFPGKNTGMGSRSLLQGLFLTQGSNLGLQHCRQILYQLSYQRCLKWIKRDTQMSINVEKGEFPLHLKWCFIVYSNFNLRLHYMLIKLTFGSSSSMIMALSNQKSNQLSKYFYTFILFHEQLYP